MIRFRLAQRIENFIMTGAQWSNKEDREWYCKQPGESRVIQEDWLSAETDSTADQQEWS